jgi:predicted RNA polymerase sigma factor
MAQRISRAKQTIKTSGVPFGNPEEHDRAARLDAVLHVLYLIFSEGYASSSGAAVHRVELEDEAIRLARMLHVELPKDPEVRGLLALMLLTDARRAARAGPDGELISLEEQDRTCWNRDQIREGSALIAGALAQGTAGPYQLQAAIAAAHDEADRADETDWRQIAALYGLLLRISDNPMAKMSRAVAVSMAEGPDAGLALLRALDDDARIAGHFRLDAVRGHLHERAGRREEGIRHYLAAANRTTSVPERNYLLMRAGRLRENGRGSDASESIPRRPNPSG